ncbi:MAG TPA: SRPBCC domain-containing protein [Streptosporangiaceae bacterium]|nr:SRPBCC domain-containing protein [Streptosporangiaceae bacterium]
MTTTTDYRTTVRVNAPAGVVFDAVTTIEALAAWWSPVTGSGLAGGHLRFPMVAGEPPLLIRVVEATRPSTVRWTVAECTFMPDWVGTQPTFTITPLGADACELTFEHLGLNDELECKDMCSRSWDHFVRTSLRELAEGGPGAPNRSPRDLARRAAEQET